MTLFQENMRFLFSSIDCLITDPDLGSFLAIKSKKEKGLKKNNLENESEGILSLLEKIPFGKIHKYNNNE